MEEDSFWPHLELFARSNKFGDQKFVSVGSDVVHQTFWLIFTIENTQVSIDTVVSPLK